MSNVIEVYVASPDVSFEEVRDVAETENNHAFKAYKVKCLEGIFSNLVVSYDANTDELESIMACFQDHFDNVGDQFTNLWGGHALKNGDFVDGYWTKYHAQDAILQVYYIVKDKVHDELPNVKMEIEGE
jgi:hypothetical protein